MWGDPDHVTAGGLRVADVARTLAFLGDGFWSREEVHLAYRWVTKDRVPMSPRSVLNAVGKLGCRPMMQEGQQGYWINLARLRERWPRMAWLP